MLVLPYSPVGAPSRILTDLEQNPSKTTAEQKEQEARSAAKPKPKFDAVTGKWVVMNWDGTVAGIPNGDQRNFASMNRSISALTGETDEDEASGAALTSDSMRSLGTTDAEPLPTTNDEDSIPFCRVNSVALESPAHRAGLKEEDLILRFGPLDATSHLKAIAELVPQKAASQEAIPLLILRRTGENQWERLTLQLNPRPWSGRGLLGCHILPYQSRP